MYAVREDLRRGTAPAIAAHHGGRDLEVAGQPLEREVARLEHPREPGEVALEASESARLEHGPVHEVLVVVHAPGHARVAVALPLVRELGAVPGTDLLGERAQVERAPVVQLGGGGRRRAARGLGQSATTS